MESNIRIARELIRMAKSLIAIDIPDIPFLQNDKKPSTQQSTPPDDAQQAINGAGDKYEIIEVNGKRRIKALREFTVRYSVFDGTGFQAKSDTIKPGDLGGVVANEDSLSQLGNCWIFPDASVHGENATVLGNAVVTGTARIGGNAIISGYAVVGGGAEIDGHAKVKGCEGSHPFVGGLAKMKGNAVVEAKQNGECPVVYGGEVSGTSTVTGHAKVLAGVVNGNAKIYEDAVINGGSAGTGAKVHGKAVVGAGETVKNADVTEDGSKAKEKRPAKKEKTPYDEDLETLSEFCAAQGASVKFVQQEGGYIDAVITTKDGATYTLTLSFDDGRMYYGLESDDAEVDESYSIYSNELTALAPFLGIIFGNDNEEDEDEEDIEDEDDEEDNETFEDEAQADDYDSTQCYSFALDLCNRIMAKCQSLSERNANYLDNIDKIFNRENYDSDNSKYTMRLVESNSYAKVTYRVWISFDGKCGMSYMVTTKNGSDNSQWVDTSEYNARNPGETTTAANNIAQKIHSIHKAEMTF